MPFTMVRNDITKMKVDAIVNAANSSLLGGGGVDGAIHRAAGSGLLRECETLGGCETGQAKITGGYDLPAKYVIHTVGPVWEDGRHGEPALLEACYRNSLNLALDRGCMSVAFPLISAGAYGYPKDQALTVAAETIRSFLAEHELNVYLVLFGKTEFLTGKGLYREIAEYIDDVYAEEHTDYNVESARMSLWRRSRKKARKLEEELREGEFRPTAPPPQEASYAAPDFENGSNADFEDTQELVSAPIMDGAAPDWDSLLRQMDAGFSETLLRLIDEKGMTDAQCYKRANVDRKLFSKIRSNPAYKPSKPTALAFAVALRLTLPETESLLRQAGYALTRSSRFDIILEYCIRNKRYDVYEINEVLFQYDMPLLGSGMN